MKKLILFLLAVELYLAFFALAPMVCRGESARAFAAWYEHPTPETRREMDHQIRITKLEEFASSTVLFGFMAGFTLLIARTANTDMKAQKLDQAR